MRQNPKKCIEWKIIECRIFDEIEELSCTKRLGDIFDQNICEFILPKLLVKQIEEEFQKKIAVIDQHYEARKNYL